MKLKLYASLIVIGLLIETVLMICDVSPNIAIPLAVVAAMGGYFIWWGLQQKA